MKLLSIILPTYNEAENIVPLIKKIQSVVKVRKEIIVVDDNSPDGTAQLVSEYKKKSKEVRLLVRKKERGLTNSIRDGVRTAKGDVVIWMDCDFSHPPQMINKLLRKIEEGYDIAVCSRFVSGGGFKGKEEESPLAIGLSRLMNYSIRFILVRQFRDYTSGFVAVRKDVFKKVALRGDYGEYFIDFIYKAYAHKYSIVEIPFLNMPRAKGVSKTGSNLYEYLSRGKKYMIISCQLIIEKHILHKIP